MKRPKQSPARRRGFTLVELLVVITILAVLVSLVVAGAFQVVGTQRQNNTEATMRTVMKVLNQHWEHVIAEAKKENPSTAWINLRLKEAFPMSRAEIFPSPINPPPWPKKYNPTYQKKIGASSPHQAACLLLALSVNRSGISLDPESLGPGYAIEPLTGLGLPWLVDGWGNPIIFSRQGGGNYDKPLLQSAGPDGILNNGDDIFSTFLNVK